MPLRTRTQRYCFIIGPMRDDHLGDQARLRKLKRSVIQPLFEEIQRSDGTQYTVETPFDQTGGNIINDVINAIDRADIVIADLTDNNPNVFYELGITHALGRPCITVVEERQKVDDNGRIRREELPFDIRAYRAQYVNLEEDDFDEAKARLRPFISRAHRESDWRRLENPVIDFYKAPLTFISPAFALAQNYYYNFVKPVVETLTKRNGADYLFNIVTGTAQNPNPQKPEEAVTMAKEPRSQLKLQVVIPTRIQAAKHNYVDRMKGQPDLYTAFVGSAGRPYTTFLRDADQRLALIDVPTTIRGIEDAVKRRLRTAFTSYDDPEFREFEAQEIERFYVMLESFISQHEDGEQFTRRVELVTYDPAQPDGLRWLHDIVRD
ncbi:MAG: nucleoside 2-deoxyribosyltransferase [Anaerolineae bacterium]|jgi:hypothetical protein|nr:nucleoside 2-deoxyribosyltransferase [Anaerolineae bacterium]